MESSMQPEREPQSAYKSPRQQAVEPGTAPGRAPNNTWESPQQCLQEPQSTSGGVQSSIWESPKHHLGEADAAPGRALSHTMERPQQCLQEPQSTSGGVQSSIWESPKHHLGEPSAAPGRALSNTWESWGLQSLPTAMCPRNLGMDCCGRSQSQVLPEPTTSRSKHTLPSHLSRVNGWSRPLNKYQAVAWATVLILALAMFGIFIPMLPSVSKSIAYAVSGGLLACHIVCHLMSTTVDPAEESVRLNNIYRTPRPTFDRTQHDHVIVELYCVLCGVTVSGHARHCRACNKCVAGFDHHCPWLNNCIGSRNYWWFFSTVASAAAWLLWMVAILVLIVGEYHQNPAVLRTDPHYESLDSERIWLLFLPYFQLRAKTAVVGIIWTVIFIITVGSLVMVWQLFLFHIYLVSKRMSTYDYLTRGRKKQSSGVTSRKKMGACRIQISPE